MRLIRLAGVALVAVALGIAAACSNDSGGAPIVPPPPGTYALVSLTQAAVTFGPPIATGTLTLGDSTYKVHIDIVPPAPPTVVDDSGTYHIVGKQFNQKSLYPNGVQTVGTFTYDNGTFTVSVPSQGISTVWLKQ